VTISGYDQTSWLIRNSWSDLWGEKGYMRLEKNTGMTSNKNCFCGGKVNTGHCSVATFAKV